MMGSVFAMQGIGQFAAGIMSLIVTTGFKESLLSAQKVSECSGVCGIAVDKMWRVIIGFGAVPGCIALYYRLTIPETPRYTFDVSRDVVKAGSDVKAYLSSQPEGIPDEITRVNQMRDAAPRMEIPKASWGDFIHHYGQWKYGKILLGTAGSWFFLDVAFYGVGLNNATILQAIGYAKGATVYDIFYNISVGNLILVCAGAIPGYWVTVATVDTVGRKPIQLGGFIILTIMFCIMGFGESEKVSTTTDVALTQLPGYHKIGENGLLACYVIAQFFFNFGPNSTTFIVPGECKSKPLQARSNPPKRNPNQTTRLPNPLPLYLPRNLRRLRQSRFHHRPSPHRPPSHPRRHPDQ
jgi:PHS family inorganic phosphate transporter-like MFS transporter